GPRPPGRAGGAGHPLPEIRAADDRAVGGVVNASYRPEEAAGGVAAEVARLAEQVELGWPEESRHLAALPFPTGGAILELGSGPGLYTAKLRELFPAAPLTAVELREDFHALAGERAKGGVRLLCASALHSGLEDESFDLVVVRYLLQHLP